MARLRKKKISIGDCSYCQRQMRVRCFVSTRRILGILLSTPCHARYEDLEHFFDSHNGRLGHYGLFLFYSFRHRMLASHGPCSPIQEHDWGVMAYFVSTLLIGVLIFSIHKPQVISVFIAVFPSNKPDWGKNSDKNRL